jgi:hypothetical protein
VNAAEVEFDRLWHLWQEGRANAIQLERANELWKRLSAEQRHAYNLRSLALSSGAGGLRGGDGEKPF